MASLQGYGSGFTKKYEIVITEYEKREKTLSVDHFLVYLVNSRQTKNQKPDSDSYENNVWRRYSEFVELRKCFCDKYPSILVPCLPDKDFLSLIKSHNELFVERRKIVLQSFLNKISSHPVLCEEQYFEVFLTSFEVFKWDGGNSFNILDSSKKVLKSFSNIKNLDKRIEDLLSYMDTLNKSLLNLTKSNEKFIEEHVLLSNIYLNLAKNLEQLANIEKESTSTWQKISQKFSQLSDKINEIFDSLRYNLLIDKPNELINLTESFKLVHSKFQNLQSDFESKYDVYQKKEQMLEELRSNPHSNNSVISAFRSVFTSNETFESRLFNAEFQVNMQKTIVDNAHDVVKKMVEEILIDFKRFERNKDKDLKIIVSDQISVQIHIAKMMLSIWTEIRSVALEL